MTQIAQHIVDAITLGSLYAMLGLGIALIFGIMRLINFAYGELITAGAYAAVLVGHPAWPVVVLIVLVVPIVLAVVMERIAFRPIRGANDATLLVTSFAVSYMLQNLYLLIFGATPRTTSLFSGLTTSVSFAGLSIPKLSIVTVAVTLSLLLGLSLFLAKSRTGAQMRAAAEDFQMARILGVRANRVIAVAFAISGVLCGVASLLIVAQTGTVTPTIGLDSVLVAFIATVLGGIGSLSGAVIGGFTLAVLTVGLESYLPPSLRPYRDAIAYATVIAVLVYRPTGLIVPRSAESRV
jgi:branched-chain amino acid transport system permease protein